MGFYWRKNTKFLIPKMSCSGFCRSTEPGFGRPSRSTDVHKRARQFGWRAGRLTRSTARELLLSESPGRLGRSTGRELCSLFQATVDRAGRPRLQRSEIWPLAVDRAGRPTAVKAEKLPQRLVFLAYKEGALGDCFEHVFKWVLHQFFLHLLRGFSTCFESKYFQLKGEFIKSVFKVISWVFLHHFNPSFLTQTLELSIDIFIL